MCGIFFSLSRADVSPDPNTEQLLRNRGPDSFRTHTVPIGDKLHATFVSTVLSLRGTNVVAQPLVAHSGHVLCWNGEAWSIGAKKIVVNDSSAVLDALTQTQTTPTRKAAALHTVNVLASIRGPYAFVYYDPHSNYIFYGRDCLGRRSLLCKTTNDGTLVLSSVCDNPSGENWEEVEADGIYMLDLAEMLDKPPQPTRIPHRRMGEEAVEELSFDTPFPLMNQSVEPELAFSQSLHALEPSLRKSLQVRIQHVREAIGVSDPLFIATEPRIAILFSGGLDCTILARLAHDLLPPEQSIDLLNVAFENPRIHANLGPDESPYELCPDRITGRSSHAELSNVCPNRLWRFVEVNVPYSDTLHHRPNVMTLMHPHNTEMDLSISYALYFASRGRGLVSSPTTKSTYESPAHVLLSGLGADELFGGYQRHAVAYSRRGYPGLIEELELDFNRLGKRNLGRDDRVISDSGKEVRFPYLDEEFISVALSLPVSAKCDFANPQSAATDDPALFLEPGKRALRLLAWNLGMKGVAAEKKRAIQFGSRTAKMETGKTKGTQVLT
ncbi:hypothetical protein P280DRAFT_486450 [Massarina eburnea CBS 473.64]|uniref:Glutamine amidotransferase type-2 domain-containing protein n=1 Tax=Massarina eburnea CBS 473.64 TaxID=1395130 RepID=A0A6A6SBN1_9PLEO|nr:hypothetical protein P280DRAFT_486450 [Massarina eburnea CBS 473.64]